jgi:hypothetical protein
MKNLITSKALSNYLESEKRLEIVGNVLMCKICTKVLKYNTGEGVSPLKKHFYTKIHLENERISSRMQSVLPFVSTGETLNENQFEISLLKAFCSANIPLSKLENIEFRNFLEKYTNRKIKSESWFRKTLLEKVYSKEMQSIFQYFSEKNIYIMFDETTDSNERYILNILIGECNLEERKVQF